jgi:hypothetical protein
VTTAIDQLTTEIAQLEANLGSMTVLAAQARETMLTAARESATMILARERNLLPVGDPAVEQAATAALNARQRYEDLCRQQENLGHRLATKRGEQDEQRRRAWLYKRNPELFTNLAEAQNRLSRLESEQAGATAKHEVWERVEACRAALKKALADEVPETTAELVGA